MNKTNVTIFLLILLGVVGALVLTKKPNSVSQNSDPHVSSNGQYVPFMYKGTFKNTETGSLFEYTGQDDQALETCLETKCDFVYFFADWDGKIGQPSLDSANQTTVRGKITAVTVNEKTIGQNLSGEDKPLEADYTISYTFNQKQYQAHYLYDLCARWKGGGMTCYPPANSGDPIKLTLSSDGKTITYATFTNTIKAEVVSLEQVK